MRNTRPIGWLKGALRAYLDVPAAAQEVAEDALTQIAEAIWIIDAFQKKSKSGIATPKHEIDLVIERLKRLKEQLR